MEIVLEGNLQHFHPADILEFLSKGGRRGSVKLVSSDQEVELFFAGDSILQARARTGWSANVGELTDKVCEALAWQRGTFACVFDAVILPDAPTLTLSLEAAVAEAGRRREKEDSSVAHDLSVIFRVIDQADVKAKIELSMQEWKDLFKIDGKKSLAELLDEAGADREKFQAAIASFRAGGLIEQVGNAEKSGSASEPLAVPSAAVKDDETETMRSKPSAPARTDKMPAFVPPPPRSAPAEAPPVLPAVSAGTGAPIMACLTMDSGDKDMFPLIDDEYPVGRDPQNAIAIPDTSISTKHARLVRTPEGFVLEDLKSRNGTFVNDEKIEKKLLSDNDSIRLGRIYLTYNIASEMQISKATLHGVRRPD